MKRIDFYIIYTITLLFSLSGYLHAQSPATDKILIEFMKPGDKDAEARGYNLLPWPEEAKAAAYKAAEIWASYLEISVPIQIKFGWADELNVAASGAAAYSYKYSDGYYYPLPLINQLVGYDKNTNSADIICVFNANGKWYYGLDANVRSEPDINDPDIIHVELSLLTNALHEICHGLGLGGHSFAIINGKGQWGGSVSGKADIYDTFVGDKEGNQLINTSIYPNKSVNLAEALTSEEIYWLGENGTKANSDSPIKIYAPKEWLSGTSISHLEEKYNKDNIIALGANLVFSPGPIVLGMLQDIGWTLKSNPTANEEIGFDSSIKLFAAGTQLIIDGCTVGEKIIVCDLSGRVVYSGTSKNTSIIVNLTSGIYGVRVGKESFKIKM